MSDYEVQKFFKRATGRKYKGNNETSINDIRKMLWRFCQERHLTNQLSGLREVWPKRTVGSSLKRDRGCDPQPLT